MRDRKYKIEEKIVHIKYFSELEQKWKLMDFYLIKQSQLDYLAIF